MKPWLLNILACPIDTHHPLEARFFSWETSAEEMRRIASEAGRPSSRFEKNYRHLAKQLLDGTISPVAMQAIEDLTGSEESAGLLAGAVESLGRLGQARDRTEEELRRDFPAEIDRLHRFLNLVEVDAGLLVCPECGRWYPIGSAVETIPELLPDDLRERDRDLAWLERWRELVPASVLEQGRPFNLSG
ncbi:MAG: Trm112 family protein [Candidatus Bathyarchaeia archaeon]